MLAEQDQIKRNVLFVLAGVAVLVLKPHYHGPLARIFYDYGGNFAVSFAVYFIASISLRRLGAGRLIIALSALLVVELFEITDGFGVMSNVYDPLDLLANAAGIALALAVDRLTKGNRGRCLKIGDGA
jgi:hypothetical protein